MAKGIDPKELVLMKNFPPDAWQIVVVRVTGEPEYGDFLELPDAIAEFVELHENAKKNKQVYIVPVWIMFSHEEAVNKLMQRSNTTIHEEDNPRMFPCHTCGVQDALTRIDVRRGYQCNQCANRLECGWY